MESKSSEREKFLNGNDIPIKIIDDSSKPLVQNDSNKSQDQQQSTTDRLLSIKQACPQILASMAALSINIPVGVVVGYSAILIPQLKQDDSEIPVTKQETGFIASMSVLIVIFGAMVAGCIVEWLGRLTAIKLSSIPYVIGWIFMATTQNLPLLFLGRFLTGFVIAMGPSTSIVYVTEVASPDLRGALISAGPALTSLGMLFVYASGAFLHWRVIAWTCIIYCVVPLTAMLLWSPESPQWLLSKGQRDKALKSIKFLYRYHPTSHSEQLYRKMIQEQESKNRDGLTQSNENQLVVFVKGMMKPTGYKAFIILLGMFTFQQLSGIYITLFFAVEFFQDVGSSIDPYLAAVMIAVIRLVVGFLTSGLMRKFGRRPLCIISSLIMTIFLTVAAYITGLIHEGRGNDSYMWIVVVCLLSYMAVSCTGLLPIPWTMTAELFPLEIRGIAQGFTVGVAHLVMFTVVSIYPQMSSHLGGPHGVQYLFAGSSLASIVFVYFFLPETHGKTLQEIEEYFVNNSVYPLSLKRQRNNETITTEKEPVLP